MLRKLLFSDALRNFFAFFAVKTISQLLMKKYFWPLIFAAAPALAQEKKKEDPNIRNDIRYHG